MRQDDQLSEPPERFAIPDLGDRSPELKHTWDNIDIVDRQIIKLLAQRKELAERAA